MQPQRDPGGLGLLLLSLSLLLLEAARAGRPVVSCPAACLCASNILSCSKQQLPNVPHSLPSYTALLDLSHNNLNFLPADIGLLQNLQNLAVTANRIEALPPELFQCRKLRALHLGNNVLQSLPSRVGELTNLTQIELRGNRLECLPVELGECPLLKRSGLVVEEDLFNTLPPEVKERLWRADKEQA